ncbi:MAG TPA: glycerol-3-phosphate acyltransferase [Ktedonobacterales bacterium]
MSGIWAIILWAVSAYLLGAIPWSVWLGALFFRADPRAQGDGNPGAANAFRAAGWRLGVAVLALDFFKAFIPVAVARWLVNVPGTELFWIAVMPTFGHAFSIFLRFRGGRGIVVMFGVWAGLTLATGPLILGAAAIAGVLILKSDELRALAIPIVFLAVLLATHAPLWMLLVALVQSLVLGAKISVFLITRHGQAREGAT